MTPREAQQLLAGDRVEWTPNGDLGTVVDREPAKLRIRWDNGIAVVFRFDVPEPLTNIRRASSFDGNR